MKKFMRQFTIFTPIALTLIAAIALTLWVAAYFVKEGVEMKIACANDGAIPSELVKDEENGGYLLMCARTSHVSDAGTMFFIARRE